MKSRKFSIPHLQIKPIYATLFTEILMIPKNA